MRGKKSGAIPTPVSVTSRRAFPAARSNPIVITPPAGVALIALVNRFHTIWRIRVGSPSTAPPESPIEAPATTPLGSPIPPTPPPPQGIPNRSGEHAALGVGHRPHHLDGLPDFRSDVHAPEGQIELPRDDARDIEQIIGQASLGPRGSLDGVDASLDVRALHAPPAEQLHLQQQGCQGGAQLV